jgi:phosphomannomutase
MVIAYAVSYAVTYIATGSAKVAQSAGLSAALFTGIGGLRGVSNNHLNKDTCKIYRNGFGNYYRYKSKGKMSIWISVLNLCPAVVAILDFRSA